MREQIQYNYDRVKVDVLDIIDEELTRIKNDPNLRHLLGEKMDDERYK
jgi:hypothetical protein